jgi:hypothetical protein
MAMTEKFYYYHDLIHAGERAFLAAKFQCSEAEAIRTAVNIVANGIKQDEAEGE